MGRGKAPAASGSRGRGSALAAGAVAGIVAVFVLGADESSGGVIAMPSGSSNSSTSAGASSGNAAPADAAAACTTGQIPAPGPERRHSNTQDAMPIPANYQAMYRQAGQQYGLPWELLAGVGMVETHHGRLTSTSSAGARGPMQFMPATWAQFGVDGDGDGVKDILNPADAIPGAANYLKASGAPDVRKALFAYNRATWYVNDVLAYAAAYGAQSCDDVAAAGDGGHPKKAHQNGRLPESSLKALALADGHRLWPAAAEAFDRMSAAYKSDHGSPICVTSSYRDYAGQVSVRARKPHLAARPGTSNHGWGLAVDLGCGINRFGTPQHEWMRGNAARFGFVHPAWAQQGGSKPEAWHWEYNTG